jgi:hypothetical protein
VCTADEQATYSFLCPRCHVITNKPADDWVVGQLVSAGVKLVHWDLPAELSETHTGPPISYDDVLNFHFELKADNWLEELTAEANRPREPRWGRPQKKTG